jgi:hypothetical protein
MSPLPTPAYVRAASSASMNGGSYYCDLDTYSGGLGVLGGSSNGLVGSGSGNLLFGAPVTDALEQRLVVPNPVLGIQDIRCYVDYGVAEAFAVFKPVYVPAQGAPAIEVSNASADLVAVAVYEYAPSGCPPTIYR